MKCSSLADTLSRAYTDPPVPENISETDIPINFVVAITEERESQLRADTECELKQIIMCGWPEDKSQILSIVLTGPTDIRPTCTFK